MFINCNEFTNPSSILKIYNTNPYIVYSLDIFFICSDPNVYASILTTDEENNAKINLIIDGILFPLKFGSRGESPLNPIKYVRELAKSKVTFSIPNTIDKVSGFCGPSNLSNVGSNINDVDDYLTVELQVQNLFGLTSKIDGYGQVEYGVDGYGGYRNTYGNLPGIIVVEVSQDIHYNYTYRDDTHFAYQGGQGNTTGAFGFGQSSFGGVMEDGNVEGFGGV